MFSVYICIVVPGFFSFTGDKRNNSYTVTHRGGKGFTLSILKGFFPKQSLLKADAVSQDLIWWSFQDCLRKVTSFSSSSVRVPFSPLSEPCPPQQPPVFRHLWMDLLKFSAEHNPGLRLHKSLEIEMFLKPF